MTRRLGDLPVNARLSAGVFLLVAGLSGCSGMAPQASVLRDAWPADLPEHVELADVPFFPQVDYQCGPAALATSLANFKVRVTPEELVGQVYLPARQGSLQVEMLAAARRYGLVSYRLAPRFEDLLREIAAGTPVIVLQNLGSAWHYAVVVGYDYPKGEFILRSGEKERLVASFFVVEYTWKESEYWAMVTVPPDRIPATATEASYLEAVVAMARVGDPRVTQAAYATFLARWPDNIAASIGLANSHYAMGALNKAEAILRLAAQRHPDSLSVMNNLAQTLSDEGRNDEALALIDRAIQIDSPYAATARATRELIVQRMAAKN
jgi:tetratricopeptide (TPR) repeat protein